RSWNPVSASTTPTWPKPAAAANRSSSRTFPPMARGNERLGRRHRLRAGTVRGARPPDHAKDDGRALPLPRRRDLRPCPFRRFALAEGRGRVRRAHLRRRVGALDLCPPGAETDRHALLAAAPCRP